MEGGRSTITTEFLSFTDDDTEPTLLSYLLLQPPQYGHLELSLEPGMIQSPPCSPISCYSHLSMDI